MPTVVTLTINPTLDVNSEADHIGPEEKLRCKDARYEVGGGGLNVSRAIHNLGGESTAIYVSGGLIGQMLEKLLDRDAVDHRPLRIQNMTREVFNILDNTTGRQFRFIMPGPTLRDSEWRRCLEELCALDPKPNYVVASGSLARGVPEDFYARVMRTANDLGARTIIDTSGKALRSSLGERVFLIKPNMRELRQLTGRKIENRSQQEETAESLIKHGQSEVVVLSLGKEGALMASSEGIERLDAPSVPVKSKIGAGDSMVAGIVLGLDRGLALRDAFRFGVAAGAAATMTPGTELCRREDTERLYEQIAAEKKAPDDGSSR
jgi:6-phosphofructokinase 2